MTNPTPSEASLTAAEECPPVNYHFVVGNDRVYVNVTNLTAIDLPEFKRRLCLLQEMLGPAAASNSGGE